MIKRIITAVILTAAMLISFSGCVVANFSYNRVINGEGKIIEYPYKVEKYNSVKIDGDFEIVYRSGVSDEIIIELQENLREYVTVSVTDEILKIHCNDRLRLSSGKYPRLTITVPELKLLDISGFTELKDADAFTGGELTLDVSGSCEADIDIQVENLNINLSGAGNLTLKGTADRAMIDISGACDLSALELEAKEAYVSISGAGNGSINCSEKLSVSISGVGDFKYKGDPDVTKNVSGLGSVKKVN